MTGRLDRAASFGLWTSLAEELVEQWHDIDPHWRSLLTQAGETVERPLAVLVPRTDDRLDGHDARLVDIPVLVSDFLSPVWRSASVGSATFTFLGQEIEHRADLRADTEREWLEPAEHLRRGGIMVIFGLGHESEGQHGTPVSRVAAMRPPDADFWIEGSHARWLSQRTLLQRSLQLYGQRAHQDPSASQRLLDSVLGLWNGLFAWHVDLEREVARGLDRFRYTDPEFVERGPLTVSYCLSRLSERGIESRGVLFG